MNPWALFQSQKFGKYAPKHGFGDADFHLILLETIYMEVNIFSFEKYVHTKWYGKSVKVESFNFKAYHMYGHH